MHGDTTSVVDDGCLVRTVRRYVTAYAAVANCCDRCGLVWRNVERGLTFESFINARATVFLSFFGFLCYRIGA